MAKSAKKRPKKSATTKFPETIAEAGARLKLLKQRLDAGTPLSVAEPPVS